MILFKMLNQGLVGEIHGCVSTGKEVRVRNASVIGYLVRPVPAFGSLVRAFLEVPRQFEGHSSGHHSFGPASST